jgi:hypothetical protein
MLQVHSASFPNTGRMSAMSYSPSGARVGDGLDRAVESAARGRFVLIGEATR